MKPMRLKDYMHLPGFQRIAASVKAEALEAIERGESLSLDGIAARLHVPLHIAGAWVATEICFPRGESFRLSVRDETGPIQ